MSKIIVVVISAILCATALAEDAAPKNGKLQPKIVFVRAHQLEGVDTTESTAVVSTVTGNITGYVDGGQMAATSARNSRAAEIAIMNPDGTGITNLKALGKDPSLSPDGSKVAFCSMRETLYFQVWVMNSDGSNQHRITDIKTGDACGPVWSPDGKRIAFYAYQKN